MKIKLPLLIFFFGFQFLFGQLQLNHEFEKKSIHNFTSIYDANQKKLSIHEIVKLPKSNFKKLQSENQDLGFTDHNYWLTFTLKNNTNTPLSYYLEASRPIIDFAELYSIENEKLKSFQKSGDAIPFSDRTFQHRKIIFRVQIEPNTQLNYYLHLKSDGEVINVPLILRSDKNLIQNTSFEQIVFGFFYGILLITAILYLFFYFTMHEKVFIYYSLYVIFIGLLQFSLDGYFYEYVLPNANWFSKNSVLIFAIISAYFLGNYSQKYLNIKKVDGKIANAFKGLYVLLFVLLLIIVFLPNYSSFCYPAMNFLGLILLLLIVYSLINVYIKTKQIFYLFSIGLSCLIIGFVVFILKNFSVLPINFLTENSSKLGTGLEVIFYSLTMANLIGELKEDKIKSQTIALKKSEEMSELKSHFLSNISHELRTPLNTILNVSELIPLEKNEKLIAEKFELLKFSSQNLLSAVNDILDFSKIENNEFNLEKTTFNFIDLVTDIAKNYQLKAEEKKLKFFFKISSEIPEILIGDKNRLQQILMNVLQNAIKFTETGFINFSVIFLEIEDGKNVKLKFEIADSGIGINDEKLDAIFDSFSQETINNKRKYGGLGLGLFIVKNIVNKYDGKINFKSSINKGSICEIELKLPIELPTKNDSILNTDVNSLSKKILIVEDNKMNQLIMKMIFKNHENFEISIANNGQEALNMFQKYNYNIILMDLQMPIMDGFEATIAIRNGNYGDTKSNIPIIAITADTTESTKKRTESIGINFYMSKPVDKQLLVSKIFEYTTK